MKKIFFILICSFCIYESIGQTTTKGPYLENNLNLIKAGTYSINPVNYEKPKLKFKHSAGPERCQNCLCPLGICVTIQFFSSALTNAQMNDGYGTARVRIEKNKLVLSFDQPAALPDGTIPIESDYFIGSEYSSVLGFAKVMIKTGIYKVTNFSEANPYGECYFDCIFE